MANRKPGRPTMSAEDWLQDDEKMLSWLADELKDEGLLPWKPEKTGWREHLLQTLNHPPQQTDPGELLKWLKARWRSHKSNLKHGKHTLRTNLSAKSHRELKQLARGQTLSHTVSRIVEEAFRTEQEKKAAIQAAVDERLDREEKSIEEVIEKRQLRLLKQGKMIEDLEAELGLADTQILELYRELLALKQEAKSGSPSLDLEQREEIFRSAKDRLARHRELRKHEIQQRRVHPDTTKKSAT